MKILILALLLAVSGCTHSPRLQSGDATNVVPILNFATVVPGKVYRGAQPDTNGLAYLAQKLNVKYIIKLNTESEGPGWDSGEVFTSGPNGEGFATARVSYYEPFEISYLPISFVEQCTKVPSWKVAHAVNQALACLNTPTNSGVGPGAVFIHCEHGEDRTGLVVAVYRVVVQGWTKKDAETEMIASGFHRELHGLSDFWEDFQPAAGKSPYDQLVEMIHKK